MAFPPLKLSLNDNDQSSTSQQQRASQSGGGIRFGTPITSGAGIAIAGAVGAVALIYLVMRK